MGGANVLDFCLHEEGKTEARVRTREYEEGRDVVDDASRELYHHAASV